VKRSYVEQNLLEFWRTKRFVSQLQCVQENIHVSRAIH